MQGKARQGKAGQGKARQGKARQGKARQGKTRQDKARQGKARQGKARHARQGKAVGQYHTIRGDLGRSLDRQDKTSHGKVRPLWVSAIREDLGVNWIDTTRQGKKDKVRQDKVMEGFCGSVSPMTTLAFIR